MKNNTTSNTLDTAPVSTVTPSDASKPITPEVTAKETLQETIERLTIELETAKANSFVRIGKTKVDVETLNKVLHVAHCKAGNLSKLAIANNLGRIAKDMSGGGTLIPTVSCLSDMKAKGLLGETDSKDGKAIVQATIEQVKALNMIVDGLTTFGLAKRS